MADSSLVRRQVELCDQASESWTSDHKDAMQCHDLQEWLAILISTYDLVVRLDERWRHAVFEKLEVHDPAVDREISDLFTRWKHAATIMERRIRDFETKQFDVDHAAALRKRLHEVTSLLTPDREFFTGQALVDLRDDAIDQHRRGQTIEYGAT